jgi:cysteine synthase A
MVGAVRGYKVILVVPDNYSREKIEILKVALEKVDCFVAGVGTGGTITGVGKRIKEKFPDALIVGVQPMGCDVLNGNATPHRIQGLAIGMLPPVLDVNIVDKVLSIEYEEAVEYMKLLASEEGLLVGISSGANVCAAIKMAKELGAGKTVVTIAPDSGRSYLEVFENNNNLKDVTIGSPPNLLGVLA